MHRPRTQVLQQAVPLAAAAEGGVHTECCQLRQLIAHLILAQGLDSGAPQHLQGVVRMGQVLAEGLAWRSHGPLPLAGTAGIIDCWPCCYRMPARAL